MLPVLFEIPIPWGEGVFPIRMFGVMVILGFLAGAWVVSKRLERRKLMASQDSFDFCFYLLAMGILGARLMYVLQNFEAFKGRPFQVLAIWQGGLVWYGGFALSAVFAFWWTAKKKLPILEITDAASLGLALALAIGRWGCFFAGDDYGAKLLAPDGSPIVSPEFAPWYAVQFPNADPGTIYAYTETPAAFQKPFWLHPVQIYMSISNFIVFGCLLLVAAMKRRPGFITGCYFMFYAVARFVVEYWRGDVDRGLDVMGSGLTFSQAFGIPVFLVGLLLIRISKAKPPQQVRPGTGPA